MPHEMITHDELLFSGNPFWFANEELLTDLLRDEIHLVTQLFARYPELREFFDRPDASVEQRAACFTVLAHRTLMDWIDETFLGRYQASPSLDDEEKDVLGRTQNLFADDAPSWVLEVNRVAELLPSRIYDALPEPLRRSGFHASDPAQAEVINSAAVKLSSIQEIQTLSRKVFDQQLQRLERRWATAKKQVAAPPQTERKKSKRQPKGTEGLGQKINDLSRYMDSLTEKQHLAFSLKNEYGLKLSEIAARMGVNRKTAYEHLNAAARRIDQTWSRELRKAKGATTNLDD
jgi:hypothetical protein